MTSHQIELLEYALRQFAKQTQSDWEGIPADLHASFARYMAEDVWTGEPGLLTLREAAIMIVRDAIARTGEFAPDPA